MRVYLAGACTRERFEEFDDIKYVLESFYTFREWRESKAYAKTKKRIREKAWDGFLLDSGAFTFLNGSHKGNLDLKGYINGYIEFINEYDVDHFFELDIDPIVGYENVLRIREYIEERTGKRCIPVWHKGRGLEEFKRMVNEYDYASIGGIVTKEIMPKEYCFFPKLLDIAEKSGCQMHGLGFTNQQEIRRIKFYSVDSTAWASGSRFGTLYYFDGERMKQKKGYDKRAIASEINRHNLKQWIKFQKYAEKNL